MKLDKRILIVDDDDNMREAMSETIKRMNIANVDTAVDGKQGYSRATSEMYDLIISDMRMPNIDGLTMFEMLKVTGIDTPICFVTAYGTVQGAVEALKIGAYDYIMKPFPPEVLEELVKRTFTLNEVGRIKPSELSKGPICQSPYMTQLYSLASEVAKSEATVLITGESGTGKEVLARFLHENSDRKKGPFVAVNCAAIPENLMESEMFGYEKGAFTGATAKKLGKFEIAGEGTILLDEIGEIPLHLQPKLLRVLQEKEVERLGGEKTHKVDTRIIATTNRDLLSMAQNGEFREDLYYRINVINIELPPLRSRKEDLSGLINHFNKKYSEINKKPVRTFSQEALKALSEHDWPGNIRELEHTIERAVVLAKGSQIQASDLFIHGITVKSFQINEKYLQTALKDAKGICEPTELKEIVVDEIGIEQSKSYQSKSDNLILKTNMTIAEMERELILKTLKKVNGNRTKAAEILGITVRTLRNKLNEYRDMGINLDEWGV